MDYLTAQISKRSKTARETAESVERVSPRNHPSLEEIAQFHELHARHEREIGHEAQALAAEERAGNARALQAKRDQREAWRARGREDAASDAAA